MAIISDLEKSWFPLGEALFDYYNGEFGAHITIKSSVEEDRQVPVGAFFREKNRFPKLEKLALKNCKGKILDAGAGAGTHALFLQNKGYETDAIDISTKAVEVMQARGIKNALAADIFTYSPQQKYDTVLLMMNGIGLAGDLAGLEKLLSHIKTLLKSGGKMVFDTTDIDYVNPVNRLASSLYHYESDYYGTVYYQLCYKNNCSEVYPWLFIDQQTLEKIALSQGFWMEILAEDQKQYLVQLFKN